MKPNPANGLANWWREGSFPLTKAIIALNLLTLTLFTFRVLNPGQVMFIAPLSLRLPWSFLTYPLVSTEIIWMLFYGLWLFSIGAAIERGWGTKVFAVFFVIMTLVEAGSLMLASALTGEIVAAPNWLPLAVLSFAFYMLNPNEPMNVWGVVQTQAKWLALVDVLIIFFVNAQSHPLAGFLALSGCALSLWWVRTRAWRDMAMYSSFPAATRAFNAKAKRKARNRRDDDFSIRDLNPFERIARARRRKQFARLIEEDEESKSK